METLQTLDFALEALKEMIRAGEATPRIREAFEKLSLAMPEIEAAANV